MVYVFVLKSFLHLLRFQVRYERSCRIFQVKSYGDKPTARMAACSFLKVFRKYLVEFEARKDEERHHMNFHIHIYINRNVAIRAYCCTCMYCFFHTCIYIYTYTHIREKFNNFQQPTNAWTNVSLAGQKFMAEWQGNHVEWQDSWREEVVADESNLQWQDRLVGLVLSKVFF